MFDYIFSFFISVAFQPEQIIVQNYDDVKYGVVEQVRKAPVSSGFFMPTDLLPTYDKVRVFIQNYFQSNSSSQASKVRVYLFQHNELAQDNDILEGFTKARKFAASEVVNQHLDVEVGDQPDLGIHFCFEAAASAGRASNGLKVVQSLSDGNVTTDTNSRCFAHYWGEVSKSSNGESFLGPKEYSANKNDQYIALYQQKTGRLLIVMAGSKEKKIHEVFAIDNFDKQSEKLMSFIQKQL